jgi:hypothetical protein
MDALGEQMCCGRRFIASSLGDDHSSRCDPTSIPKPKQRAPNKVIAIWRIEEDQVACGSRRNSKSIGRKNGAKAVGVQGGDVGAQDCKRSPVPLDERCVRGAARQRLEAKCAGAGKHVQDMGTFNRISPTPRRMQQHIEQCLPHAVCRWARLAARRCDQCPAAPETCDDPHLCRDASKQDSTRSRPKPTEGH